MALTADTITDEQIRDACAISTDEERAGFGCEANFYNIASRQVEDRQARRVYGEVGVRNTRLARARCAEILNQRAAQESK